MSASRTKTRSKLLSLVLRHEPGRIGLTLDREGWVAVDDLLVALAAHGTAMTRAELDEIVATSDKRRFALSDDGARIRAAQGHSVAVELGYEPAVPPEVLYHGTVEAALPAIRETGLRPMSRHDVHLSADPNTAAVVGGRRGRPVVLTVRAGDLHRAGHALRVSSNGVWLTAEVPPSFIDFPEPAPRSTPGGGDRARIAADTLAACERGHYDGPHGRVALRAAIDRAVAGTVLCTPDTLAAPARGAFATVIDVTGESTIEAIRRRAGHPRLACLNFASAKNPGGGFQGGAQAQEESLARASALYPCLVTRLADHYAPNRASGSLLYLDLAIWSPDVPFFRDDHGAWLDAPVLASVITCAAPNAGALRQRGAPELAEVPAVLARRAALVLGVAAHHGAESLVLGAWGAGVFGNDPAVVADAFGRLLDGPFAGVFRAVTFAVLDGKPGAPARAAFTARFALPPAI